MDRPSGQNPDSPETISTGISTPEAPEALLDSNRRLKRRIFDFYTILELSRKLNSVLDLKSLLDSFLNVLLAQTTARKTAVFQRESRQTRNFILTNWLDTEKFPPRSQLSENSEIVKNILGRKTAMTTEELIPVIADHYENRFLMNFAPGLVIPLQSNWGTNGILLVGRKLDNSGFTNEDKEFLLLLSGQMAVALENARLYEAEKRAIADLQATQEQLVHSERLAALGEMSAKIAHEINNPLGIIKNYLMLIQKAQEKPSESAKYVEIVGQEIERITGIVRELLQLHQPQQADYKEINVLNVLEEVITFLTPQFTQAKIKCTRNFAPNSPQVEASAENLKQVFINVLLNAVDAMPEGGSIDILAFNHEGKLRIRIQDSGPGVSKENLPHIFEPFFTTKEAGKGTGLGLAVCYSILQKHHGTIRFKNTEKGGCVDMILPAFGVSRG